MTLARKSIVLLATSIACLGILGAATADAKWKPAPARIDTSFGRSGWAAVPMPHGSEVDAQDDFHSATTGPGNTYFVVADTNVRDLNTGSGGIIVKFNSRGKLEASFGKRGAVRTSLKRQPLGVTLLDDGSMILLSGRVKNYSVTHWVLTRLGADGSKIKSFGVHGEIQIPIPDLENKREPRIFALGRSRFAVVGRDYDAVLPLERLSVFSPDGRPDLTFGINGVMDFPFEVNSVSRNRADELLVAGNDGDVLIAKVNDDGSFVQTWGVGGVAKVSSGKDVATDVKTASVGKNVLVVYDTSKASGDESSSRSWAQQLDSQGVANPLWGVRGKRLLTSSATSPEYDGGDWWFETAPLGDGRIFVGDYSFDDYGGIHSATLGAVGRSGKARATGSTALNLKNLWEFGHAPSADGRYLFIFGERRDRTVAGRIRL